MANFLFICSKNQWRSLTAEILFKNHALHLARSAGTSEKARIRVNQKLIDWADEIFVMERKHKTLLIQRFPEACNAKQVYVMEIEDNYRYGDKALIELLKQSLEGYL